MTPTTPAMTPREADALASIRRWVARFGVAPTRAELGRCLMVSAPTAHGFVQGLRRKGYVAVRPGWRGLEVRG